MGVSFVTGKLGGGKGKFAVMKLREAHIEGRRIAGNVDIYLEHFAKGKAKARYIRVPDKPTAHDLNALGHGNPESYDEDRNGLLVLDELGTWFNSRSFQDKERAGVLDWMIHARKHGWDVLLICQNEIQIDKQAREALGEVFVRCMAMHKVKLPLIGSVIELFSRRLARLPRFHIASVRVGTGASSFVSERIWFRGDHLHPMYDTRQIFVADSSAATVTLLSPFYFSGLPPAQQSIFARIKAKFRSPPRPAVQARATLPRGPFPAHLKALPADTRWKIAQRHFPHTPYWNRSRLLETRHGSINGTQRPNV